MKILKDIKNNYKTINITILCVCIFMFLLPEVMNILEKISPVITKCPYLTLTGKPCPLCGGTRFIRNMKNSVNDLSYFFNFFGVIVIIVILEIIFRIINILKNEHKDIIIKIDIFVHIIIFILYTIYEIFYII